MNKNFIYIIIFSLLLSSCGGSDDVKNEFYKKKEIVPQNLEVTVEASGMVEAISSIEIKSKASGEVLLLGAEVGDFVEKGSILAQIDQRTPKNILDQSKSDLEAAKVRLTNAEAAFDRGKELHIQKSISDQAYEESQL